MCKKRVEVSKRRRNEGVVGLKLDPTLHNGRFTNNPKPTVVNTRPTPRTKPGIQRRDISGSKIEVIRIELSNASYNYSARIRSLDGIPPTGM